jgi:hypothetical protein
MQFVKNGPDVPEKLLQAHEEGRVVFFCGAGISFPAKLPGFGRLVRELYKVVGVTPNAVQEQALKSNQFDTAVSLLEAVKPTNEWRRDVRKEMAKLLQPDYSSSKATLTHKALLQLSTTFENKIHLITTNFDRIFKQVAQDENLNVPDFKAPLLPVPKNKWDGLVYLHGLLPESINGAELDYLVVSSGDFGLAYLIERWAARFVSELFRSFTVCFVGYSLNDPVLRYMMDALAADRLLGESPPEMFAFGNYKKGEYEQEKQQWLAKNVTPILYKNHSNHYYLHETLTSWSETYRDGLSGKEQIVITTAFSNPSGSDLHNDYARKLAWALSDRTGYPAKRFSKLNPAPPLEWLNVLAAIELKKEDLSRFEIFDNSFDEELKFNLFNRPAKSSLNPNMSLSRNQFFETKWDNVMLHLGNWLARHLNNPQLVLFILKQGGVLNSQFRRKINFEIEDQKRKKAEGDKDYFATLSESSPDAIVSSEMFIVWSLVLAGYCEQSSNTFDLYSWADKYKFSGITAALKKELTKILTPIIQFRQPYNYPGNEARKGIKGLLEWDIKLSTSFAHSLIKHLNAIPEWKNDAALLLPEFNALLKETMDIMAELNEVEEFHDYSYIHHPSIKEHPQNKDYRDWTVLIDLVRDSWLSLQYLDVELARSTIINWWRTPYPIFKRLALFAAAESELIPVTVINTWLEENKSRWLWSVVSQRELFQLLLALPPRIDDSQRKRLLNNIAAGPQREWFREELSFEEFIRISEREIWLRLEKLKQAELEFDEDTKLVYQSIVDKNPKWKASFDEKDEFPFWMGDGSGPRQSITSPLELDDLIQWLKDKPDHDRWDEDDWSLRCKNDFEKASQALLALVKEGFWIAERWREALQIWTEDEALSNKAWEILSVAIFGLCDGELTDISWNLSRWLSNKAKSQLIDDDEYLPYFDKLMTLPYKINIGEVDDPLNAAINHPVGILTESIFGWWFSKKPNDNDGLVVEFKKRLDEICDVNNPVLFHGKAIVASNLLSLFRVDPEWTIKNVLPWFKWTNIELARMSWRSYLWTPRLHQGLLLQLKPDFLATSMHYEELGTHKEQYARFLTYIALQQYDEYKATELTDTFSILPPEALYHVASSLNDGIASSGDKLSEYWDHRVKVFLHKTWPKRADLTDQTVNQLGLLCLKTKEYFEEAFELLKHNFKAVEDTEYIVREIMDSKLIQSFPMTMLNFLNALTAEPKYRPASKLKECLEKIVLRKPELAEKLAYKRLSTIVKRFE